MLKRNVSSDQGAIKVQFHPIVAHILLNFSENMQKKMKMNVCPSTTVMWI